jgi:hypothetical protein
MAPAKNRERVERKRIQNTSGSAICTQNLQYPKINPKSMGYFRES